MLGWPVRRKRAFSCGLNLKTCAWLGPTDPEKLADDFLSFFQEQVVCDGNVFLQSGLEEVNAEIIRMAGLRGHSCDVEDVSHLQHHQIFSPGQLVRLQEYGSLARQALEKDPDSAFFADLDQNAHTGSSTCGPMIPSLLTHGSLYSFSRGRIMTGSELLFTHGYNCFQLQHPLMGMGLQSKIRRCRIGHILKQLPVTSTMQLLGNGWHLPVIASWVMYVLCHTVRISGLANVQAESSLLRKGGSTFFDDAEAGEEDEVSAATSKRIRFN